MTDNFVARPKRYKSQFEGGDGDLYYRFKEWKAALLARFPAAADCYFCEGDGGHIVTIVDPVTKGKVCYGCWWWNEDAHEWMGVVNDNPTPFPW